MLLAALALSAGRALAQAPNQVVVDHPPTVIAGSCATPAYPLVLKQAGIQGMVTLEFLVSTEGFADSTSMKVTFSSHPLFIAPAKAAILSCRYQPGSLRGQALPTRSQQTIHFRLTQPDSTPAKPGK